jgi:hypothetical protein
MTLKTYYVTDAAAFPALPFPPGSLLFRNGLFQTAGIDYELASGQFAFQAGFLSNGDGIAVVTFP